MLMRGRQRTDYVSLSGLRARLQEVGITGANNGSTHVWVLNSACS